MKFPISTRLHRIGQLRLGSGAGADCHSPHRTRSVETQQPTIYTPLVMHVTTRKHSNTFIVHEDFRTDGTLLLLRFDNPPPITSTTSLALRDMANFGHFDSHCLEVQETL